MRALVWIVYIVAISALGVAAELYFVERAHASTTSNREALVVSAGRGGAR